MQARVAKSRGSSVAPQNLFYHLDTMAALTCSSAKAVVLSRASARPTPRRLSVVASAQRKDVSSRREVLGASAAAFSLLLSSAPAHALFEASTQIVTDYTNDTTAILDKVKATLALDKDDPAKEDNVKALRKDINSWVAKYRREDRVAGKPSFGNTYSALNALAGHFNSFGATAPIPKKRLERLQKELDDAALLLTRNR
ncbi:hypothetical protein HYH03_005864 [Edaphochlamys debaryana]|uniref:Uncharacterized protein n=1 Tax=Edaphochlamys debaryana TaxID=47281 RepID=A0A835Y4R0_9CHLO|nr:hypothetical protein HYH03_005864 [Edaphochlamys debaryana]|eukprot:KAG2495933.1 hypothetical protein HYH03_005864 [Edaphochlamys debaryana]